MVLRRNPNYNMTIDLFLLNVINMIEVTKKNQNCRLLFPSKITSSNLHAPPKSLPQYRMLQRDMNKNVTTSFYC